MYFSKKGPSNTVATLEAALRVAGERGISRLVVASGSGKTALSLADKLPCGGRVDIRLTCVTSAYGFHEDGKNPMPDEARKELRDRGVTLVTAAHVLSGVERGLSSRAGGMYPAEIISHTLRMFGQGVKVCVEIAVMALDAGAIPHGEEIIAVAGTGGGADTAVILSPAHAGKILQTRIHEIICKPHL